MLQCLICDIQDETPKYLFNGRKMAKHLVSRSKAAGAAVACSRIQISPEAGDMQVTCESILETTQPKAEPKRQQTKQPIKIFKRNGKGLANHNAYFVTCTSTENTTDLKNKGIVRENNCHRLVTGTPTENTTDLKHNLKRHL
jgi:hypothetical protein